MRWMTSPALTWTMAHSATVASEDCMGYQSVAPDCLGMYACIVIDMLPTCMYLYMG